MPKTLKHDIKADFILERGIELLWSKGYNATSVNDIVKAADIPKGSFYFYFDSKEDFTVKALEKYFDEQFPKALAVLQDPSVSPKQRILNFYDFRTKMIVEKMHCKRGCMGCNLASEMAEHSEAIRNIIAAKGETIKTHISEAISLAQETGEIKNRMNSRDLTEFIEDAGKGAMTTMKELNDAYPITNYIQMIKSVLLV